jgi:hypothetical protein
VSNSVPAVPVNPAREAVVNDLLWLTHEGYVIEFADGRLESVPPPKNPPKPETAAAPISTEANEGHEGKDQAGPDAEAPADAAPEG